jgi:Protein of unknown function (DUF2809)
MIRIPYLILMSLFLMIGLASRAYSTPNGIIHIYLGDVLWAAMIYCGLRSLLPSIPKSKTALYAISFCFLIEISQLYQAQWINNIRHTTLGGLVLGFGFLWGDLVSYSVGIVLTWLFDSTFLSEKANKMSQNTEGYRN